MKIPFILHWKNITLSFLCMCCILLTLVVSGCGDDYSSSDDENDLSNTGSYACSIKWPDDVPSLEKTSGVSRTINCDETGVVTVAAKFYDGGGSYLTGGEWSCSLGEGTVYGIPAGSNRRLVVTGEDASGTVLYRGEETGIEIVAGQTTQGGEIPMDRVQPTATITSPSDGSSYTEGDTISFSGTGYDTEDVAGLLKDRLVKARERLEELRESIKALCEPVEPPHDTAAYMRFFCTPDSLDIDALNDNEPKRIALYKLTSSLLRAYANLANEMREAGDSEGEAQEIRTEVEHYEKVREEVKLASGDYIDMKVYEPAMRHLLDTYIQAEESEKISAFDDMTLVELIVERGEQAVEALPKGIRANPEAMAESIENNIRRVIIDEMAVNPKYYERMSDLLNALIQTRKKEAIDYKAYLAKIVDLTRKVSRPETQSSYPATMNTAARRALFDNLDQDEELAVQVDTAIRNVMKAGWRGIRIKEREVRIAIKSALGDDSLVDTIFEIVKNQRDY